MKCKVLFVGLLILSSCNNLEDAELADRTTFIKVFNGIQGIEAAAAEITPDGFIVVGNMTIARDSVVTVVFKTDTRGNRMGPVRYYQGGSGNAIKAMPGNNGYLIVGEKIKTDPNATPTDNIDIISARMLHISNDLDSLRTIYLSDTSPNEVKVDYKATTLTITPSDKIIILGTYQRTLNDQERPFIQQYNNTFTTLEWWDEGESFTRSYRNAKSVHYNNGKILYASAVALEQQNFNNSWISVNQIPEGSTISDVDLVGSITEQSFQPADIQPGNSTDSGFGLVATRSNTDGTNANMFFARVSVAGKIIPSSLKFYDTALGITSETESQIQEYGQAITSTKDGYYVLAGHFQTSVTLGIGSGGNDVLLIKVDPNGNLIWKKTIGGTGGETTSTIRETEDRGLLICGTNTVNGIPSIFLIKTDRNGDF
ncbi:hypothetical protein QQ054_33585 [Oscillatoria amoena NRMC-F 0135]|nr:hypothetical protein [Oscillatoria amoena NRMC-F 0135]